MEPITIRRLDGGVVEVVPRGEIDLENAHELRDAIDTVLAPDEPVRLVRVDLGRVPFIDSVGISALVSGYHTLAVRGARLVVTDPTEFVYRQLYISGLVGLFSAPQPAPQPGRSSRDHDEPESEPVG